MSSAHPFVSLRKISKEKKPKTLSENKRVAKKGGSVAGLARKDLEKKLGRSIISPLNAKELKEKKTIKKLENKQRNANNKYSACRSK